MQSPAWLLVAMVIPRSARESLTGPAVFTFEYGPERLTDSMLESGVSTTHGPKRAVRRPPTTSITAVCGVIPKGADSFR